MKRSGSIFGMSEGLLGSLLRALGTSGAPFWEPWSSILGASGSPGIPWRRLCRQKSHRTDFLKKKGGPLDLPWATKVEPKLIPNWLKQRSKKLVFFECVFMDFG